jgi:hypothetical protein
LNFSSAAALAAYLSALAFFNLDSFSSASAACYLAASAYIFFKATA